ncbi:ROK family transcriptional regulator [Herbiconiux sp. CPCC 205763]|uniref:ROK family transcriptional regulator n=1 Tax=Herbiconiux aconitum TaxID=2970913 RepID=A0ABT2GPJ2_9MICO|nr:ROK family transcriptional regulator [Herbiconiux aconitum]MCS5717210.1 ROK family transcriptional regulator [Herbiconiux aconitum]
MTEAITEAADRWSWPELHDGQRAVLREVVVHGSRSRADLARRTGFSRTSLSRLTRDLVELQFIVEGEIKPRSGRGRPSEMLDLRPESAHFAGVKLTGEALYAVVTDLHAVVVERVEHPLPASKAAADVVELIGRVVADFRTRHRRLASLGVCLAGDVEEMNGRAEVIDSPFLGWDRVPLQGMVEKVSGLPTVISNDVQALTVAHHWFGAGVGHSSLAVVSFGAGIGAGLVVRDELVWGARGHTGKVGHLLVSNGETAPVCDHGHRGCVSAWVTVPAVIANAGAADLEDALRRAEEGDPRAVAAVEGGARALGAAVAYLVDLIDPQKVIVTGEGLPMARLAEAAFHQGVEEHLDPSSELGLLDFWDFDFADYAWAASISAIRRVVQRETT